MLHWSIEIKISCRQKGETVLEQSRRALELVTRIGEVLLKNGAVTLEALLPHIWQD